MTATDTIPPSVTAAPQARTRPSLLSPWLELTKFRLSGLVVMTTAAGFLLAHGGVVNLQLFLVTIAGTWLAAGGAMVLNQWQERDRDALMERTRLRPLPARRVTPAAALAGGLILATAGLGLLALAVNGLTAALGLAVVLLYTLVYTPLKTRSSACTLVGAVCGALPPMMGWSAATGGLGFGAWVLAGILFVWQIPHFLSLAWLYRDDYARGGFRMLPVTDPEGSATTRMVILYSLALVPVALGPVWGGHAGWIYGAGSIALGLSLLFFGKRLAQYRSERRAGYVFAATLAYLPLLLVLMVADRQPGGSGPAVRSAASSTAFHLDGPDGTPFRSTEEAP